MSIEIELQEIRELLNNLKQDIIVSKPSKASIFIQEYLNNEDLNNDGMIYGYDFKITDNDHIPEILKEFQKKFKKTSSLIEYDWKTI